MQNDNLTLRNEIFNAVKPSEKTRLVKQCYNYARIPSDNVFHKKRHSKE